MQRPPNTKNKMSLNKEAVIALPGRAAPRSNLLRELARARQLYQLAESMHRRIRTERSEAILADAGRRVLSLQREAEV